MEVGIFIIILIGIIGLVFVSFNKNPHSHTTPEKEKSHQIRHNRLNFSDWSELSTERKLQLFERQFKDKSFSYQIEVEYTYGVGGDGRWLNAILSRSAASFTPRELGAIQLLELMDEAGVLDSVFAKDWGWRSLYTPLIWGGGKADINNLSYKFANAASLGLKGANGNRFIDFVLGELYRKNAEQAITDIYQLLQSALRNPKWESNPFIQRAGALFQGKSVVTPSAMTSQSKGGVFIGGRF